MINIVFLIQWLRFFPHCQQIYQCIVSHFITSKKIPNCLPLMITMQLQYLGGVSKIKIPSKVVYYFQAVFQAVFLHTVSLFQCHLSAIIHQAASQLSEGLWNQASEIFFNFWQPSLPIRQRAESIKWTIPRQTTSCSLMHIFGDFITGGYTLGVNKMQSFINVEYDEKFS